MEHQLTKAEKKLCPELMAKGLETEFENGIREIDSILAGWKNKQSDNRTAYHAMHNFLRDHRKHLAQRYDGITGSHYLNGVAVFARDKLITESNIEPFSEESKKILLRWSAVFSG